MIEWICILPSAFFPDDGYAGAVVAKNRFCTIPSFCEVLKKNKPVPALSPLVPGPAPITDITLTVDVNGRVICKPCIWRGPTRVATHVGDRILSLNGLVPPGRLPDRWLSGSSSALDDPKFQPLSLPETRSFTTTVIEKPRLAVNMRSFLSILCVLATTASTEAFWVMNTSELPLKLRAHPNEWDLPFLLVWLTAFTQKMFSSLSVSTLSAHPARSPPTFTQVRIAKNAFNGCLI